MLILSKFRSKQNVFSSCIKTFINDRNNWSNIDDLVAKTLGSVDSIVYPPDSLLKLAYKGLQYQIFDASFWNDVYDKTAKSKDLFTPSQWIRLLHIYKRIKIRNSELYNMAQSAIERNLENLSLKELSLLSLSFSYFSFCPRSLFSKISKTVCDRHRDAKLKEFELSLDFKQICENGSLNKSNVIKRSKISETVSYIHMIGAYSKCGFDDKELFEVVTEKLIDNLSSHHVMISSNLLMKTLDSYSRYLYSIFNIFRFGYRNIRLLDTLSNQIITAKLSTEELSRVKSSFSQLEYENDTMNNIFSYRLGNVN
ncbi:uncharacterized protein TA10335 [Theileria annulata]|uniref:Uncharacterized protein n=1 Tax=Theileria annulata TaxID=5874 RepID=Q4U8X1_THEAN|nr:uncharacterized protein TA10335 [Theileria annulata]CAI76732.1 hypothetical protein, conserved [Theileria annulata]|eukprot:XP_953357.1 hypothetical protein, conserved [Theileria annulata]